MEGGLGGLRDVLFNRVVAKLDGVDAGVRGGWTGTLSGWESDGHVKEWLENTVGFAVFGWWVGVGFGFGFMGLWEK